MHTHWPKPTLTSKAASTTTQIFRQKKRTPLYLVTPTQHPHQHHAPRSPTSPPLLRTRAGSCALPMQRSYTNGTPHTGPVRVCEGPGGAHCEYARGAARAPTASSGSTFATDDGEVLVSPVLPLLTGRFDTSRRTVLYSVLSHSAIA